jgi:hypothetical protein
MTLNSCQITDKYPNCPIFLIKSVIYVKVTNVENKLEKFDSFVQPKALLTVQSTARHAIHLQFDISTNALEI